MIKIIQPFRNPGEYKAYLEGVGNCALAFGHRVDSAAWGGGIPIELALYTPEEMPAPVVTTDVYAAGEEKAELPTVEAVEAAETDADTEAEAK